MLVVSAGGAGMIICSIMRVHFLTVHNVMLHIRYTYTVTSILYTHMSIQLQTADVYSVLKYYVSHSGSPSHLVRPPS